MVEEKKLDPAAADKIGQFVRISGGAELVEELSKGELVRGFFSLPYQWLTFWGFKMLLEQEQERDGRAGGDEDPSEIL